MDINSLHTSISKMADDVLFKHIKHIRSLRRMLLEIKSRPPKKTTKKKAKKSITNHVDTLTPEAKAQLLKKLLKIKERKDGNKK